jgi:hypothetical protein
MNIVRCLTGQFLALLSTYKFTYPQSPATFTTDLLFVPATCLLLRFKYKLKYSERSLLGATISGSFYISYIYKLVTGSNIFSMDYTILISSLGYLISIIFKYLISDNIPKNIFHYIIYSIILLVSSILVLPHLNINLKDIISCTYINMLGTLSYVSYTIIVNIICNEVGIKEYLIFSSSMILIMYSFFILIFWRTSLSEIYKVYSSSILDNILYYLISLIIYIGTVVYIQVYGIMYANMIQVSNLLFTMYIREYNIFVVGGMYIFFIYSTLRK